MQDQIARKTRPPAEEVTGGLTVKAEKIRRLARAGYTRVEISRLLEIRYQHVRHVLVRSGMGTAGMVQTEQSALATGREPVTRQPAASWETLLRAGFHFLGEWMLESEGMISLDAKAPEESGVYAFVLNDEIVYIGLTRTGLCARLNDYRRGNEGQATSLRVKRHICQSLAQGNRIKVLTAVPEDIEWNGLPVHTAAGLESALIQRYRPQWNVLGKK